MREFDAAMKGGIASVRAWRKVMTARLKGNGLLSALQGTWHAPEEKAAHA
jgi:hypothetical protein